MLSKIGQTGLYMCPKNLKIQFSSYVHSAVKLYKCIPVEIIVLDLRAMCY